MNRCGWAGSDPLYIRYHDEEWGVPVFDDRTMFEFLVLESAQAGLSWLTILRKRHGYRAAFFDFDPQRVARLSSSEVERLLLNAAIIRNRMKIEATIQNARAFLNTQEEFGSFSTYLWAFVDHAPIQNGWKTLGEIPARTDLSERISNDMKKRGFSFLGPTVIYAHLQAVGLVNDHTTDCFRHRPIERWGRTLQE